ncbi:MAG: sensor histidine kinase [Chitinophagaceae bacterium]
MSGYSLYQLLVFSEYPSHEKAEEYSGSKTFTTAMIKDLVLKAVFIPLLGVCLPLLSGIITYGRYSTWELILANSFFIATSFAIWTGCNWIHQKMRPLYRPVKSLPSKMVLVCLISGLYGACVGGLAALMWIEISGETMANPPIYRFVLACVAAVILFTLVYEILFLSKERELDTQIVHQLDRERSQAELQALANELDPHFIFNSLNTLNHLIRTAPTEALNFNYKLASVYKYFLLSKNKELISLQEEMDFLNSYFYLLKIRFEEKLHLETSLNGHAAEVLLPPCSLQILLENAIKHNEFSETDPLTIQISLQSDHLKVSNRIRPKMYAVNSTGIGLKNLGSRYRLLINRSITVENSRDRFTVKLPLIHNQLSPPDKKT